MSATQFRQEERQDGSRVGGYLSSSSGSDDENREVGKNDSFKTSPLIYGQKKSKKSKSPHELKMSKSTHMSVGGS